MSIYTGLVATDEPNSNGDRFTKEALEKMVDQAKGLPVTFNFIHDKNHGVVESSVLTESGLVLEMKLNDVPDMELYAVPGGKVIDSYLDNMILVINDLKLTEISLTTAPADKHITPISLLKGENNDNTKEMGNKEPE